MPLQGTILLSLMDIASGMTYLHSLGIVHRSVLRLPFNMHRPNNVATQHTQGQVDQHQRICAHQREACPQKSINCCERLPKQARGGSDTMRGCLGEVAL